MMRIMRILGKMMIMMMRSRKRASIIIAGRILNASRSLLGCLLEACWKPLGASWGSLGGPWGALGASWVLLLGGLLLGASWGSNLGSLLGPPGRILGASWGHLGGLSLGLPGRLLGPSWRRSINEGGPPDY